MHRAKKIQNQAKINKELSPNEIKKALEQARLEIIRLKSAIALMEKDVKGIGKSPLGQAEIKPQIEVDLPIPPVPVVSVLDDQERESFINRLNELEEDLFQKEK